MPNCRTQVIFEAYRSKTITTMVWSSIELESFVLAGRVRPLPNPASLTFPMLYSLKQQRLRDQLVRQTQPPPPVATGKRKK